jgi:protein phosphatase
MPSARHIPTRGLDLHPRSGFKLHGVDDLMPIGQFSDHSGLSPKRLRSYAAEGLLVPAAVDPASGYRYYSPGQLHEAQVIDALRRADIPLADIGVFLRHPSDEQLVVWAQRLDTDATDRKKAFDKARNLLANEDDLSPVEEGNPDSEGVTMARLRIAGRSETGPVRENNEDVIVNGDRLAVVADGMGGLPGGEIAATAAAALVGAAFTGRSLDELEAAVRAANWAIWDRAVSHPELAGMGTTICAAGLLEDGTLVVVHVGDSRAYLWHDNEFDQLTQDHTVTSDLVGRGELREEDAPLHPHYGILTRALGVAPDVAIDRARRSIVAGDRVLVCSDGLTNELSTAEIASALGTSEDVKTVADKLVGMAIARGGRDNVSVVVAEVVDA